MPNGPRPILAQVLASAEAPQMLRENAANLLARANQPETLAALAAALPIATARMQTTDRGWHGH